LSPSVAATAQLKIDPRSSDDLELIEVTAGFARANRRDEALSTLLIEPEVPTRRLDVLLADVPGVGLFRRADSFTAHPTTQGISMRAVGANAAGRVAVTLDGVPLNDPFGGWIYWAALDPATIARARVRRGGGLGAAGQGALAGQIALESAAYDGDGLLRTDLNNRLNAHISYGSFDSLQAGLSGDVASDDGTWLLSAYGGYQQSDGFFIRPPENRGPVDRRARSDVAYAGLSISRRLGDEAQLTGRLRWFDENRLNALALAENSSNGLDVDLIYRQRFAEDVLTISAYWRDRDFANIFTSAREGRSISRPVLDQFDVPAESGGLRLDYTLRMSDQLTLDSGVEGRFMRGSTNERFRNLGAGFTRLRRAGGEQWLLGGYVDGHYLTGNWQITASLRGDFWRSYDGRRREFDLADTSLPPLRDDIPDDQRGFLVSGRAAVAYQLTPAITARAAFGQSMRLPTLNEYYRPFRVGNDITEANGALRPERLSSLEAGLRYQPLSTLDLNIGYFRHWLRDAVGNVTIGFGPGFFPLGGFVPAGGVLRQRDNIDLSVTDGIEARAGLIIASKWRADVAYQFADARVVNFAARPDLEGLQLPQTARHSLSGGLSYADSWGDIRLHLRFEAGRFDDDLNQRRLNDVATLDLFIRLPVWDQRADLILDAENILDATVQSALDAGLNPTLARARRLMIGLRMTF